jgi:L-fuculose-phosphate aldolase
VAARRAVVRAARAMHEAGLVVGTVGNVSARAGGDRFLITPSRAPYARMRGRALVLLDGDGRPLTGGGTPSREWRLHAEVYRRRPDVGAVVHTHSAAATAWTFGGEPLALATEEVGYFDLGTVALAPFAPAATAQLAQGATDALGAGRAVLLERHGVVAVGATPDEALTICAVVERQALVALLVSASMQQKTRESHRSNASRR